jgi:hypothetical protein
MPRTKSLGYNNRQAYGEHEGEIATLATSTRSAIAKLNGLVGSECFQFALMRIRTASIRMQ